MVFLVEKHFVIWTESGRKLISCNIETMVRYTSRIGASGGLPTVRSRTKRAKPKPKPRAVSAAVIPPDPTLEGIGGGLSTGGALRTGGALSTGGALVDNMTYPDMIHTLGSMDGEDYHVLQGLASMFLPSAIHPLKRPLMDMIGGAFKHPPDISKVATNDVLRAPNPRFLSRVLHSEWLDRSKGMNTGGGLFDTLKNLFKRGVKGLSKGSKSAVKIGKKLMTAIDKGKGIAKSFQAPIAQVSPGAAKLVERGLKAAEQVQRGLGLGIGVAEPVAEGLARVSEAVE